MTGDTLSPWTRGPAAGVRLDAQSVHAPTGPTGRARARWDRIRADQRARADRIARAQSMDAPSCPDPTEPRVDAHDVHAATWDLIRAHQRARTDQDRRDRRDRPDAHPMHAPTRDAGPTTQPDPLSAPRTTAGPHPRPETLADRRQVALDGHGPAIGADPAAGPAATPSTSPPDPLSAPLPLAAPLVGPLTSGASWQAALAALAGPAGPERTDPPVLPAPVDQDDARAVAELADARPRGPELATLAPCTPRPGTMPADGPELPADGPLTSTDAPPAADRRPIPDGPAPCPPCAQTEHAACIGAGRPGALSTRVCACQHGPAPRGPWRPRYPLADPDGPPAPTDRKQDPAPTTTDRRQSGPAASDPSEWRTHTGPDALTATYRPPSPAQQARIAAEQARATDARARAALADVADALPDACPVHGYPHALPCPDQPQDGPPTWLADVRAPIPPDALPQEAPRMVTEHHAPGCPGPHPLGTLCHATRPGAQHGAPLSAPRSAMSTPARPVTPGTPQEAPTEAPTGQDGPRPLPGEPMPCSVGPTCPVCADRAARYGTPSDAPQDEPDQPQRVIAAAGRLYVAPLGTPAPWDQPEPCAMAPYAPPAPDDAAPGNPWRDVGPLASDPLAVLGSPLPTAPQDAPQTDERARIARALNVPPATLTEPHTAEPTNVRPHPPGILTGRTFTLDLPLTRPSNALRDAFRGIGIDPDRETAQRARQDEARAWRRGHMRDLRARARARRSGRPLPAPLEP